MKLPDKTPLMTADTAHSPDSGKQAGDENFPVGSWLLPARLRPHVATFYAYARAIDDVADHPELAPDAKLSMLEGYEAALGGNRDDPFFYRAHAMRRSLAETGVTPQHCLDLISAFKQDAVQSRYRDWDALMDYCDRSAAPVGRYLLDLHGESARDYSLSDPLCNALQVINHLQDCQADYRDLNRVYLPQDWLEQEHATVEMLTLSHTTPELRRVLDRALAGTDELLRRARPLPNQLVSRRLGFESGAILGIAETLAGMLRRKDPLAERVVLGGLESVIHAVAGAFRRFTKTPPLPTP